MGAKDLKLVAESSLIDSHPTIDALADLHVPFKTLTGDDLEADLGSAIQEQKRVGVSGPVGGGKSSMIQYALAQHDRLAPISVNVAKEEPGAISDPRRFFGILTSQLLLGAEKADEEVGEGKATELETESNTTKPLPGKTQTVSGGVGVKAWVIDANLGGDLQKTLQPPDKYNTFEAICDATVDALQLIREAGLTPVLVADDADRLLRLHDKEKANALYRGFFGEVLRAVADFLETAVVIAVQDEYREREDFGELHEGRIESFIEVPLLETADQFEQILNHRLQRADDPSISAGDICEDEALEKLAEIHREGGGEGDSNAGDIRSTFNTLRGAFSLGVDDGSEKVTARHIEAAAAG